jgi:hypothetical protein
MALPAQSPAPQVQQAPHQQQPTPLRAPRASDYQPPITTMPARAASEILPGTPPQHQPVQQPMAQQQPAMTKRNVQRAPETEPETLATYDGLDSLDGKLPL